MAEDKDSEPGTDNIANMLRGEMDKALDVDRAVGDNFLSGQSLDYSSVWIIFVVFLHLKP